MSYFMQPSKERNRPCSVSNNDPTTLLDPKSLLYPIREYGPKTLRESLGVGGLSFAVFSAELAPGQRDARVWNGTECTSRVPDQFETSPIARNARL